MLAINVKPKLLKNYSVELASFFLLHLQRILINYHLLNLKLVAIFSS